MRRLRTVENSSLRISGNETTENDSLRVSENETTENGGLRVSMDEKMRRFTILYLQVSY